MTTIFHKCWTAFKLQGAGWCSPILIALGPKGRGLSDDEVVCRRNEALHPPLQTSAKDVPEKINDWLDTQFIKFGKSYETPSGVSFFNYLLFNCYRRRFIVLSLIAIWNLVARTLNSIFFAQFMAILAGAPSKLDVNSDLAPIIVLFSVSTLLAQHSMYWLTNQSRMFAKLVREEVVYFVGVITVQSKLASVASTASIGEFVGLLGGHAVQLEWCLQTLPYCIVAPLDIGILAYLTCRQVGTYPGLIAFTPLVAFMVFKFIILRWSKRHQKVIGKLQTKRLNVCNDGIVANSAVKLLGMEQTIYDAAMAVRRKEELHFLAVATNDAFTLVAQIILAPLMAFVAMRATWDGGDVVSLHIFTILGYFRSIITNDVSRLIRGLQCLNGGLVACDTLVNFFTGCDRSLRPKLLAAASDRSTDALIEFDNVAVSWTRTIEEEPLLKNISFSLPPGQLVGISGPIACGKSSLLMAMMGELRVVEGLIKRNKAWTTSLAYAAQKPFLPGGSVLGNITGADIDGTPIIVEDQAWLDSVINSCGLRTDIDSFEEGLQKAVGQQGTALSGGQQARVALARAVYRKAKITVLDDVLCALDPTLGAAIFRQVIAQGGLLRGKQRSVVMVTQNHEILKYCDTVLTFKDGSIQVTHNDVVDLPPAVSLPEPRRLEAADSNCESMELTTGLSSSTMLSSRNLSYLPSLQRKAGREADTALEGNIAYQAEVKETDLVIADTGDKKHGSLYHFMQLYILNGVFFATLAALAIVGSQGVIFWWQFELHAWYNVDGAADGDTQSRDWSQRRHILGIAGALSIIGSFAHYFLFLRGASRIQGRVLSSVLHAPLTFFTDNQPTSRIYNSLLQDSQEVEYVLAASTGALYMLAAQIVATCGVLVIGLPPLIAMVVPFVFFYIWLQRRYSLSSVPLKNKEAASRAPVIRAASDIIEGLPVYHAFGKSKSIIARFLNVLTINDAWASAVIGANEWMTYRANVVVYGAVAIISAITIAILFTPGPDSYGPFIISNIFQLSGMFGATAMLASNMESSLTAVGRLLDLSSLASEVKTVREDDPDAPLCSTKKLEAVCIKPEIPDAWPTSGNVVFINATIAYKWVLPPAVQSLSVNIPHGSSCAFVGRSGSGKSTSVLALVGMIPILSGRVEYDGVDVRDVSVRRLREAMAVVPQTAVMFTGTVRYNLDHQHTKDDADIWQMLSTVGLKAAISELGGLDAMLDPQASLLSQGQKQLLCLARALLRDTQLLVLDEANASVDEETEEEMVRIVEEFQQAQGGVTKRQRTIIEIAHRLSSVLQMDQVVVMRDGVVIECGNPQQLIEKRGSEFAKMVSSQLSMMASSKQSLKVEHSPDTMESSQLISMLRLSERSSKLELKLK